MKITIYVNYRDEKVLNEKEFEELVNEKWDELRKDEDDFAVWLNDRYDAHGIWSEIMCGLNGIRQLDKIKEEFEEEAYDAARDTLEVYEGWEKVEMEV